MNFHFIKIYSSNETSGTLVYFPKHYFPNVQGHSLWYYFIYKIINKVT